MKQYHAPAIEEAIGTATAAESPTKGGIEGTDTLPSEVFMDVLSRKLDTAKDAEKQHLLAIQTAIVEGLFESKEELDKLDKREDWPKKEADRKNAIFQAGQRAIGLNMTTFASDANKSGKMYGYNPLLSGAATCIDVVLGSDKKAANKNIKASVTGTSVTDQRTILVVAALADGEKELQAAKAVHALSVAYQGMLTDAFRLPSAESRNSAFATPIDVLGAFVGTHTTSSALIDAIAACKR